MKKQLFPHLLRLLLLLAVAGFASCDGLIYNRLFIPVCTFTYDGNGNTGGTAPAAPSPYAPGDAVEILGNSGPFTKEGCSFNGWNSTADGSGTPYVEGESFTMGESNFTIYAQWTPNYYTIIFDANGGSGSMESQQILYGTTSALLANTFTRDGYTFEGWALTADGSAAYADNASYTMGPADITLFAAWKKIPNTVGFYTFVGVYVPDQSVDDGGKVVKPVDPVFDGYTFEGWYSDRARTDLWDFDNDTVNGGTTLYAKWSGGNTWKTKAAMTTARFGAGAAEADGRILVIGGQNTGGPLKTVEEYNPSNDTWSASPRSSMIAQRAHPAVVKQQGLIYAIGGYDGTSTLSSVEIYNPTSDSWSAGVSMNYPRQKFAVSSVYEIIYAFGGDGGSGASKTIEIFDPDLNTWSEKTSAVYTRAGVPGAANTRYFFIIGGYEYSPANVYYKHNEIYDTASGSWLTMKDMPNPRCSHAAALVNGKVYIFGGFDGTSLCDDVYEYNPDADTWNDSNSLPAPMRNMATAVTNGRIYIFGGEGTGSPVEVSTVLEYLPPAP